MNTITQPQEDLLKELLGVYAHIDVQHARSIWRVLAQGQRRGQLTKQWASETIESLQQRLGEETQAIPAGRYAIDSEEGVLSFYRVTEKGRVLLYHSDEQTLISAKAARTVLVKIAGVTPAVAGKRYADEIGCCWRCGRTLTDEASRSLGQGPVCASIA
jgi:hypothetical protein